MTCCRGCNRDLDDDQADVCKHCDPEPDTVNHPNHYTQGGIEVIDAIEAWGLGFCEGNVVKYVARAKFKMGELEDLKKARWYLDRCIEKLEGNECQ